ncbi:complement C1q-like protein 3 [Ruditapes philippinarum]|uniref:complement C1q-like protein 3 n=1 Tax=Ruditapes philippinarum TaxID=129788 RepID=UPI00295B20CB|nr:complement C1q-like protein 3 [Ruditapes philippinarum]
MPTEMKAISLIFFVFSAFLPFIKCGASDNIEALLEAIFVQNQRLESKVERIEEDLRKERGGNQELRDKVEHLEVKLTANAAQSVEARRQLNDPTVAFTAVISPSDVKNLQPGQTLIFDRTITNMGNAYDISTGIFTAPIRGVYVLHMDIMIEPGNNEYLQFVKDGAHILFNYIHANGGRDDVSSSRTVVTELEHGSQVWIRTAQSASHGTGTIHGNEFSTFSGWLLTITE